MGLGGYFLTQFQNWQDITNTSSHVTILATLIELNTFVIVSYGCCAIFKQSQSMVYTYALVVGVVLIIEVVAAIILWVQFGGVRTHLSSHVCKSFLELLRFPRGFSCSLRPIFVNLWPRLHASSL